MRKSVRHFAVSSTMRATLCAGASALALISAPATAQIAPDEAPAEGDIVVTASRPIAESEAVALAVQRNSDSLIAVVAADAVGRLPDQNIAQAASRLPGVAVERDQGQPRYINLRGAPKTWSTVSFDGITIVSPEGRDTRYDSIPSALAGRIEVIKAVTPNLTGETISGNVNIVTRSPFDHDGFSLKGKLGYGIGTLGNRPEYEASLIVSNTYETGIGEIGVLIGGSYYQRNMITDNFESDWEQVAQDQRPGSADRYWVRETENKLYRLTRKNWSLSSRLEWRPDSDNKLSFTSLYSIFTDDEARDNYIIDADDRQGDLVANTAPCATTVNPTPTTTGYADVCIGNTPTKGTLYGVDINQRSTLRAFRQSVFTNTLAGRSQVRRRLEIEMGGQLHRIRSTTDRSSAKRAGTVRRPARCAPRSPMISPIRATTSSGYSRPRSLPVRRAIRRGTPGDGHRHLHQAAVVATRPRRRRRDQGLYRQVRDRPATLACSAAKGRSAWAHSTTSVPRNLTSSKSSPTRRPSSPPSASRPTTTPFR